MAPQKARIVFEYDVRFDGDMPAFTSDILCSNPDIEIFELKKTPFGAKFKIMPKDDRAHLVSGSINKTLTDASRQQESFVIFGRTLHEGQERKIEELIQDVSVKEDIIEFSSDWIHDELTAKSLANWVKSRLSQSRLSISLKIMGNPLLEVGDILRVKHTLLSLEPTHRFVIRSVRQSWSAGLETEILAIQI
jgi:hypothetical protein